MNKQAYIILNEVTKPIENMYDRVTSELKELKANILTEDEALKRINQSSLVIVTDNHRKNSTEGFRTVFEFADLHAEKADRKNNVQ